VNRTDIEWTDYSWPVVNGCRRKSEGCRNCYAEKLIATRLRKLPKYEGLAVYSGGPRWTGETRLWLPELVQPLRKRGPGRVFVADMGDLFYERVSNEDIAAVFGVMAACPQFTFQVLTKRPERAAEWFRWANGRGDEQAGCLHVSLCGALQGFGDWDPEDRHCEELLSNAAEWPLPNVHIGVSAEDQDTYNARVPLLVHQVPAVLHFVSIEPQLGPIKLRGTGHIHLGWVICGGESGHPGQVRHFDLRWARSLRDECRESGIPFFFKQAGTMPFDACPTCSGKGFHHGFGEGGHDPDWCSECGGPGVAWPKFSGKGGKLEELPEDLRIREFPHA
jgi:protein gp37